MKHIIIAKIFLKNNYFLPKRPDLVFFILFRGIKRSLTDTEIKEIEERIKSSEDTKDIAKALHLSYDRYCQMESKR